MMYAFIYFLMLHHIRASADELPLRITELLINRIEEQARPIPQSFSEFERVDMQRNQDPITMTYDSAGVMQTTNAWLHGSCPSLPRGSLYYARKNSENRLTWQPEKGVRYAMVIVPFDYYGKKGFVAGGASLKEPEKRIASVQWLTIIAATITIFIFLVATFIKGK